MKAKPILVVGATGKTGRRVRYVPVPAARFVQELIEQGLSPADAGQWTAALSPIERGLEAKISDGVPAALGREPRDFATFVQTAVAEGAWRS